MKIKKSKGSGVLKSLFGFSVMFMAFTASGCTLAVSDAGTDGNGDRLIGAFITSEYLDLYDMEGYLNDHASSLVNNSSITIGNDSRYEGKLVATVDKEGAQSSSEWKISFGDVKGEYILMPVTEDEDGNTSVGSLCSNGVGDPYLNYNVTDDGETQEISATVYQVSGKTEHTQYVNPVFQKEDGEIYAMAGNGYSNGVDGSEGNTMAATLSGETTTVENGKTKTEGCKVTVQFATMYKPVRTIIYQMDEANKILKQTTYKPSDVPDTLKVEAGTAYILEETRKEDASGKMVTTRTILDLDSSADEEKQYLEAWYPMDDGLIGKKDVEIKN
ncbi:hypothetical protein LIQ05_10840 [Blautia glucerasea]|uniref:hypothetical protein n=1 Tax=Blautia glucerasea TaxID=536633 RepID=UPI001D011BF7|nr:hypothetical protein [Blautia glucerasea]MCB5387487.1 hypothetical protein [Blautia glucerasea]MCB5422323.1 hypothetical protein [Blautia luti]